MIAEKYGQSPNAVEEWEERWFNRAVLMMEGENLYHNQQMERAKKGK